MANPSGSAASGDVLTDLLARYGKQAIQLFAALAGAGGLFYSIGFIIVNVSLLRLGVYETALISVGYVAPGIAFSLIFVLSALGTIGTFVAWQRVLGTSRLRRALAVLPSLLTVAVGSFLLGYAMWFFKNVALGLVIWSLATNFGIAVMAYAEHLPLINRMILRRTDADGNILSASRARLNSPPFLIASALLAFFSVLLYGLVVYDQVPPVFGGGLPIVVRFFGKDVGDLDRIGINLEPGETTLTERVELLAQTEDRYIVRVARQAISFDQRFVQGIRYEPPEFFLDEAFFLASHTRQGEGFLAEEQYENALSEFNLVLDRNPRYAPALRGRVAILTESIPDFEAALQDYLTLTEIEPQNGDHYYGLATVYVYRAQTTGQEIEIDNVIAALTSARIISATLGESARADPIFDSLRGDKTFDVAVYGSGPDAARWFAGRARAVSIGASEEAIAAYRRALEYAAAYADDPNALSAQDVAELHVALSKLYDPISSEALAELQSAVAASGDDPNYLISLGDLYLARGDTINALSTYDRALKRMTVDSPNRLQALIGRGQSAFRDQKYAEASAAFRQALALSEADAATWYDYARSLAALGDPETESALRKALELDRSLAAKAQSDDWDRFFSRAGSGVTSLIDGVAHFKAARERVDQNNLEAAALEYQAATAADERVPEYWVELGDVLSRLNRYTEAAAAYQSAVRRLAADDPQRPAVQIYLGSSLVESGDAASAIDVLIEAITAQGSAASSATYELLAHAYELTQQYDLAAVNYDEAANRTAIPIPRYAYRSGLASLLAGRIDVGLGKLEQTIAQAALSVEVDAASLRVDKSLNSAVLKPLPVGVTVQITGQPEVSEGLVWWPVVDSEGEAGWVNAAEVAPPSLSQASTAP